MATTNDWLQTADSSELAFTLLFDGYDLAYTTTSDTAGIDTALPTDFTNVKSGLMLSGNIDQSIEPFKPSINVDRMSFRIVDQDGTLRNIFLGEQTTVNKTRLYTELFPSSTTAEVTTDASTNLAASGTVYIGHEAMSYTSITNGTENDVLNGLTRGVLGLWQTSSSTGMGMHHRGVLDVKRGEFLFQDSTVPTIRDAPRIWYNRQVALILHHKEGGAWSTVTRPLHNSNAQVIWAGRIKEWVDEGDGAINISCVSVLERLSSSVMSTQFTGRIVSDEMYLRDRNKSCAVFYVDASGTNTYPLYGDIDPTDTFAEGYYSFWDVMSMIQDRFTTWINSGDILDGSGMNPLHAWSISYRQVEELGARVVIEVESDTSVADEDYFEVGLHNRLWFILGFHRGVNQGEDLVHKKLEPRDTTRKVFRLIAPLPPRSFPDPRRISVGEKIRVLDTSGTWVDQNNIPAESDQAIDGFLKIGEHLIGVTRDAVSGTTSTFTAVRLFQPPEYDPIDVNRDLGTADDLPTPPEVRQVWVERDKAGDILLRLLLSTGSSSHNDATYDVYTGTGFGLGLPYDLVDVQSFQSLDAQYELLIDRPRPFREILEQILITYNRHVIFNERITLTRPGFDAPNDCNIITLDEDSKARQIDRPQVSYGTDGIINRIELQYETVRSQKIGRGQESFVNMIRSQNTVVVEDEVSQSDYGHRRTLKIQAEGVLEPDAWAEYVAKPAIAYFSRPTAIITRSISTRGAHIRPGDVIKLTDDNVVDPADATRGIAGLACWVKSVRFDWTRGEGQLEMVFLPDHPASQYRTWSPSAKVVSWTNGTKTLVVEANAYSRSADGADASHFENGDNVQIREIDPVDPTSPVIWSRTVDSVSGNNIVLTTDMPTFDATLNYVVESEAIDGTGNQPQASQREHAYIADDADQLVNATYTATLWSGDTKCLDTHNTTITTTQEFIESGDDDDDANQCLSTRKYWDMMNNCNNLLAYKTRNILISVPVFTTNPSPTSGNTWTMLFGPVFVPIMGTPGHFAFERRTITAKIHVAAVENTSDLRLRTSAEHRSGGTDFDVSNIQDGLYNTTDTATAVSVGWTELTATPAVAIYNGVIGTWVSVDGRRSAGGSSNLEIGAVFVVEDTLA